jgi:hypothetical protein
MSKPTQMAVMGRNPHERDVFKLFYIKHPSKGLPSPLSPFFSSFLDTPPRPPST